MSDNYRVIYSPEALEDIRKIYSHIAYGLQAPDTALNQVNRIRKEIRSLDFMPMRYSIVDWEPWKSMQMHKVPVDNYVVYYLADSNIYTVTVIRIVYGGQDIESNINSEPR
ncbi:MAG: type II toxin-antitoxin system RelE/ParE family toxin [Clostridium sp.]|nr:type II toxin-antitoxin system RelE/ParE family toxin [Acetatifactor muris]MCM1527560.1 type II toxin-antitoxin system RelE/ParE family toxin [Bacteroides sp.]MCM1563802.1 type II toxin-antitoxin system RelE/ParE family toxin [Clostridium sp.]